MLIEIYREKFPSLGFDDLGDGVMQLEKRFAFRDFRAALDFSLQVGELAEQQGHHPSILTEWGKVTVTWWTHKIRGLHRNDFICAARTDRLT